MIINPYSFGPSLDPDAQAFLTAASITDATISGAINTLVVQMKADNIWTKMKAIYPMVGGTASTHKWNLKDPRDLDAAFRLVFSGGITHNSNGMQGNGVNGYANTFFIPSIHGTNNNTHLSVYLRTNSSGAFIDMGCYSGGNSVLNIIARWSNIFYGDMYDYIQNRVSIANNDSRGLFNLSRISSNSLKAYKNSAQIGATNSNASTGFTNLVHSIYLAARNDSNSAAGFSPNQEALASIGDGLTDTDVANYYIAVQAFQTTLSRQV